MASKMQRVADYLRAKWELTVGAPEFLSAFGGFSSRAGRKGRAQFEVALVAGLTRLLRAYRRALPQARKDPAWIEALEKLVGAAALDHVLSPRCRLKAWHDQRVAADLLEQTLQVLAREGGAGTPTALDLAECVVRNRPAWRAAWIALGEMHLAGGRPEEARRAARQALSLLGECAAAQSVLYRASTGATPAPSSIAETGIALHDLRGRFCSRPFDTLSVVPPGDEPNAILCDCAGWLPFAAGKLSEADSVDAVWNSEAAVEIRRSIHDGDFTYCSRTQCPHILANTLPLKGDVADPLLRGYIQNRTTRLEQGPRSVQLSYDHTCNLACPSCRTRILTANAKQRRTTRRLGQQIVLPLLRRVHGTVLITGLGDPFASKHYLSIIQALNPEEYPHLQVDLQTNGLLFTPKLWDSLRQAQPLLRSIGVSIDAATADTYHIVRRPGRWTQLQANLAFMSQLRQAGQLTRFDICFVVQKQNFREMADFVRMGLHFKTDHVRFLKLWNLGSYEPEELQAVDVASPAHPLHPELLRVLADPIFDRPEVDLFNLAQLRRKT